jgi:hypothetical protein
VSNLPAHEAQAIYDICAREGYVLPSVYQGGFNPVARGAEEALFPTLLWLLYDEREAVNSYKANRRQDNFCLFYLFSRMRCLSDCNAIFGDRLEMKIDGNSGLCSLFFARSSVVSLIRLPRPPHFLILSLESRVNPTHIIDMALGSPAIFPSNQRDKFTFELSFLHRRIDMGPQIVVAFCLRSRQMCLQIPWVFVVLSKLGL